MIRLAGRYDHLGEGALFARAVDFRVLFVALADFGVGWLGPFVQSIGAERGVTDAAAFGPDEIRTVFAVECLELFVARLVLRHEQFGGQYRDRSLTAFTQLRGVAAHDAVGELGAENGGNQNLPRNQPIAEVVAHDLVGQPLAAQRLLVQVLAEIAVRAPECGQLHDLAVDKVLARAQAHQAPEFGDRDAVQQRVEHLGQTAILDELFHRQSRLVRLHLAQRIVGRLAQIRGGDFLVPHDRHIVGARKAAEGTGGGNICTGEGERDQDQKADRQREAQLRLEEGTKEVYHQRASLGLGGIT